MGGITVKPEHKPEQREKLKEMGGPSGLAFLCFGIKSIRSDGQKHALDRLAQQDATVSKDGLTVVDGRFGWGAF
jgi:hypothetical protein